MGRKLRQVPVAYAIIEYLRAEGATHTTAGVEITTLKLSEQLGYTQSCVGQGLQKLIATRVVLLKRGFLERGNAGQPPCIALAGGCETGDGWKTSYYGVTGSPSKPRATSSKSESGHLAIQDQRAIQKVGELQLELDAAREQRASDHTRIEELERDLAFSQTDAKQAHADIVILELELRKLRGQARVASLHRR